LYDLIVLIIFSVLKGEISPLSKTSNPSLSGTRIRAIFMNSGDEEWVIVEGTTSQISNLAALLPISMAANLTMLQNFFCEETIGLDLGSYFLFPS